MKKYESKAKLDIPADKVLALMSTAEYIQDEAFAIGAEKATAKEKSRDDKTVVIIVDRDDPTRDPSAKAGTLEKNEVTVTWDLAKMKDSWKCKIIGKEKMVQIEGETWIEAAGSGCVLKEKGSVDIKIPMIGNMIAKGIVDDLKDNVNKKAKLIKSKIG